MRTPNFTPGPWRYQGDSLTHRRFDVAAPFGGNCGIHMHICTVNDLPHHILIGRSPEVAEANARLISDAPEMYRLLRICEVEIMPDDDGSGNRKLWEMIRACLKRIEGEEINPSDLERYGKKPGWR